MRVGISNYFWILLISMVPIIELRGAIPVAIGMKIHPVIAFLICIIGNMIPVPFILLFIRPIFRYLKKFKRIERIITRLEEKAVNKSKSKKISKYSFWGLALFVAIPLPGTGAWTGALIAALLNIRLKYALPSIFIGVITAGLLVSIISTSTFAGIDFLKGIFFIK